MPKGFIKIVYLLLGSIVMTGCFSQMISPLTFGPLLVLDGVIYGSEGAVGSGVLLIWRILTGVTYIQLVTLFLQFGALYLFDQIEKWENGELVDLQKHALVRILPTTIVGVLFHILGVFVITWLHFPAVRGVDPYPGVLLQTILVGANFLLGLWIIIGMALNPNGRSRGVRRRPKRPRSKVKPRRWLGRRQSARVKSPRGRLADGTVLPKPTERPRRDSAFTRTENDENQASGRSGK